MELQCLPERLTVCKLPLTAEIDLSEPLCFAARTADELSLVCAEARVPETALAREDGWRALRVSGTLDFSLIGILSRLTGVLAEAGIGLFAVSTFDTDYLLVRDAQLEAACDALRAAGYTVQP